MPSIFSRLYLTVLWTTYQPLQWLQIFSQTYSCTNFMTQRASRSEVSHYSPPCLELRRFFILFKRIHYCILEETWWMPLTSLFVSFRSNLILLQLHIKVGLALMLCASWVNSFWRFGWSFCLFLRSKPGHDMWTIVKTRYINLLREVIIAYLASAGEPSKCGDLLPNDTKEHPRRLEFATPIRVCAVGLFLQLGFSILSHLSSLLQRRSTWSLLPIFVLSLGLHFCD